MITRIHHVSLLVADSGRALGFYRDILGLAIASRPELGFPGAWLEAGEQQIHLLELPNPDPVAGRPEHGGRDRHVAFAVDDLDALIARLDTAGIPYTRSRSAAPPCSAAIPTATPWSSLRRAQFIAPDGRLEKMRAMAITKQRRKRDFSVSAGLRIESAEMDIRRNELRLTGC